MNLLISIRAKTCIKKQTSKLGLLLSLLILSNIATADGWKVDLSRRSKEMTKQELAPTQQSEKEASFFDMVFNSNEPLQEIVLLNTDKGFVPSTLRLKEGLTYQVNIVNVNEKEKNVSFVLDAFSEHHATYFGKIKTFNIKPQKEGIFSFVCPETSAQGKLVVYPAAAGGSAPTEIRQPASSEN